MRGEAGRRAPGNDQVDRKMDQLGRQGRKSLRTPLGKTILEAMTLSLDVTQVPQPVPQSLERWPGLIRENTDFPQTARRLRPRHERPRDRRAAEQRDELTPLHSITSSARTSRPGGTVKPSAFAVLILITNSNLVGCWTGKSVQR